MLVAPPAPTHGPKGWLWGIAAMDACPGPFTRERLGPGPPLPCKLTPQFFSVELHGNPGASLAGKVGFGNKTVWTRRSSFFERVDSVSYRPQRHRQTGTRRLTGNFRFWWDQLNLWLRFITEKQGREKA